VTAGKADRVRRIVRLVSAAALAAGAVLIVKGRLPEFPRVPLRPLVVSPEMPIVSSIPAEFGALAGQNLILVTLDTTRADRIGFYGNDEIETPNLDRLASQGVVFTKAVATASSTLPTHASILTGLYPQHHGARANSLFKVAEEQRTLAEILSENGYETAAFVSSVVLDARFGLAQGFGVYDDQAESRGGEFMFTERRGDQTTDRAIAWLRANAKRPFFLWVHYYDPHTRYDPPEPFASEYALPYDGEIAFVDQQLGRLLEAVESTKGPESFVVVTADHGEALGEDGEESHSHLVQEATIQIPLVFYSKRGLQGGLHVDVRTSQVDLLPTILPLLGIAAPEALDGVDLALASDPNRAVLAETVEGRVNYGWARSSALYEGPWKIVMRLQPELYDLSRDPIAHVDLSATKPGELMRLRGRLSELHGSGQNLLAPSMNDLSAFEIERLDALGYRVGSETGVTILADGPGPEPRELLPILSRLDLIVQLPERADAIRKLEALAGEHPDFAPVYVVLNRLYTRENRPEEARWALGRLRVILQLSAGGRRPDGTG
jgi:hypothetical protein